MSTQNNQNNQNNRNNAAAARNTAAVDAARKQVTQAQAVATKAQTALDQVVRSLRTNFESSPEMTAAQAALNQAQTQHDAAAAKIAAALQNDPAYQAALKQRDQASARLDALRNTGNATPEQITAADDEVLQVGTAASQIRSAAESADPSLTQSRARLTAADSKLSDLRQQFQESLKADPKWVEAKKAVDDAKAKLAPAEAALNAALAR